MKIKPLFDRVVLLPIENESETKGGILLPMAAQEKSQLATVVAIGSGEKVLYGKFTGTEITIDEVKYVVIRQPDILAIIE